MDEIQELFLSGIASAKGGNRRLAEAFFKRVIGKNPLHEGAWVWLAEVLDDPDDIAYCLEAALQINPHNEKARIDLGLVQKRRAEPPRPREWSSLDGLLDMDVSAIMEQVKAQAEAQKKTQIQPVLMAKQIPQQIRSRGLAWAIIFSLTVILVLALSIILATGLVQPPGNNPANPTLAIPTIDVSSLREQERREIRIYFQDLDMLLGPLRLAHDIYRGQSNTRVSLADQVAYTSRLQAQIWATLEALQQLEPPEVLAEAHQEYVQGLLLEREALDSLMDYFETSQAGYANRATVKLQEAGTHLERAKAIWAAYRRWAGLPEPTRLPTPTVPATPTYGPTPSITPTIPRGPTLTPTPLPTQPVGQ